MSQADSMLARLLRKQLEVLNVLHLKFNKLQQCHRAPEYMLGGGLGRELHIAQQILEAGERVCIWRAQYCRNFWTTCPDDVLRAIFEIALDSDALLETFGLGEHDALRTRLPFAVSAVCTRWRRVALDSPRLWTYASLPPPDALGKNPSAHVDRIELLLLRSRFCPIDVLVDSAWALEPAYDLLPVDDREAFRLSVLALVAQSSRWWMAQIWLPCDAPMELLDFLGSNMPRLRLLSVVADRKPTANASLPAGRYLAQAPRLREFDVSLLGLEAMNSSDNGLPSPQSVRIWHPCSHADSGRLISLFGASLRSLDLQTFEPGDRENPCTSLDLPNLTSLCLRSVPFFEAWSKARIALPKLHTLSLHVDAVFECMVALMDIIASTVTHLELFGAFPDPADLLNVVKHLRSVTHLALAPRMPFEVPCDLSDNFFVKLADAEPCVWPRLTSIRLDEEAVISGGAQGIVHLLAKRNRPRVELLESADAEGLLRIREVVIHAHQTTASSAREIARLVAAHA